MRSFVEKVKKLRHVQPVQALPPAVPEMALEGIRRLFDYQGSAYARHTSIASTTGPRRQVARTPGCCARRPATSRSGCPGALGPRAIDVGGGLPSALADEHGNRLNESLNRLALTA